MSAPARSFLPKILVFACRRGHRARPSRSSSWPPCRTDGPQSTAGVAPEYLLAGRGHPLGRTAGHPGPVVAFNEQPSGEPSPWRRCRPRTSGGRRGAARRRARSRHVNPSGFPRIPPITQFDGGPFQGANCTLASGADARPPRLRHRHQRVRPAHAPGRPGRRHRPQRPGDRPVARLRRHGAQRPARARQQLKSLLGAGLRRGDPGRLREDPARRSASRRTSPAATRSTSTATTRATRTAASRRPTTSSTRSAGRSPATRATGGRRPSSTSSGSAFGGGRDRRRCGRSRPAACRPRSSARTSLPIPRRLERPVARRRRPRPASAATPIARRERVADARRRPGPGVAGRARATSTGRRCRRREPPVGGRALGGLDRRAHLRHLPDHAEAGGLPDGPRGRLPGSAPPPVLQLPLGPKVDVLFVDSDRPNVAIVGFTVDPPATADVQFWEAEGSPGDRALGVVDVVASTLFGSDDHPRPAGRRRPRRRTSSRPSPGAACSRARARSARSPPGGGVSASSTSTLSQAASPVFKAGLRALAVPPPGRRAPSRGRWSRSRRAGRGGLPRVRRRSAAPGFCLDQA